MPSGRGGRAIRPRPLTGAVAGFAPTPLDCTESPHLSGVAMESRRPVVAGLTIAAVALIVAGVVAVAIDSESRRRAAHGVQTRPATAAQLVLDRHALAQRDRVGACGVARPDALRGLPVSVAAANALGPHHGLRGSRRVDRLLHGGWHGRADGGGPGSAHGARGRPGAVLRPVAQPIRPSGRLLCGRVHAERDHAAGRRLERADGRDRARRTRRRPAHRRQAGLVPHPGRPLDRRPAGGHQGRHSLSTSRSISSACTAGRTRRG